MTMVQPGKYIKVINEGDTSSKTTLQQTLKVPVGSSISIVSGKQAPAPQPPPSGLPVIPAGYGTLLRKVFTDGALAPFKKLTYLDDHIGQPGQFMTQFCRYTNAAPTVHDGYLDLRATKRTDGTNLWDAMLVGTSFQGDGPTFGYGIFRFWLRWNLGPGVWQASWLYDTTTWAATELDWIEMLENQQLSAHVLGVNAGGKYEAPPADIATAWHMFSIERRASFVSFTQDGVEFFRQSGAMPAAPLAILLDTCVGHGWVGPTGGITPATPNPVWLQVAAVTVDP